jgi:cytoskeleton protein RodZ
VADIGSLLRDTRMRERIDITTVESATKIRAKYLRALENEEWDQLPGPTFVRTFLRTYAEYLGLDPKLLVEEYKQRFERPGPQDLTPFSARSGAGRRPPRPSRGIPPWVIVGVAFLLLIGILFALGTWGGGSGDDTATTTPPPAATAKPTESKARKARRKKAATKPKVVSARIIPEGSVYVCLVDAKGKALIDGATLTGSPSKTYRSKRMRVTFGNGAVRMRLNGKTYGVPDSDRAIAYSLRPGARPKSIPEAAAPTCA